MKTGKVNSDKIIGIANRLRVAPKSDRAKVVAELLAAIDEEEGAEAPKLGPNDGELSPPRNVVKLREMLQWPEIRNDALATARIAKLLVGERDK